MASCTPTIAIPSITFDCDIPLGGLSRVYVGYLEGASGIAGGWKTLGIDVTGADGT